MDKYSVKDSQKRDSSLVNFSIGVRNRHSYFLTSFSRSVGVPKGEQGGGPGSPGTAETEVFGVLGSDHVDRKHHGEEEGKYI
jgi:hypothetical protein